MEEIGWTVGIRRMKPKENKEFLGDARGNRRMENKKSCIDPGSDPDPDLDPDLDDGKEKKTEEGRGGLLLGSYQILDKWKREKKGEGKRGRGEGGC